MEPQQQTQPATGSIEEPAAVGSATAAPQQQPIQGGAVSLPQDSTGVFTSQGVGLAPSQQTFDSNGTFSPTGMTTLPDQHAMAGVNGAVTEHPANSNTISADEIALYDRQIRLWGMKAQKKIQAANILLITMKALANEIAKNLVLAGIGSLTLVDDQNVSEADLGAQFFLSEENIGQNRAEAASREIQKLNPRVKVIADSGSIMEKGVSYFSTFDIVIATDLNATTLAFINTATRVHHRQFYAAGSHGYYGYIFCDLIEHDFVLQREKANISTNVGQESRTRFVTDVKTQKEGGKTIELVAKRELYSTWDLAAEASALPAEYLKSPRRLRAVTPFLSCLRALWAFEQFHSRIPAHNRQDLEYFTKSATQCHSLLSLPGDTLNSEILRSFLQNIGSEIAPVTAVLGGELAQDVINVLGQNQQPIQNMVIFDGNKMEANQYALHPEGPLGIAQLEPPNPMMPAMVPAMMPTMMPTMMPMGDPQMGAQLGNPQMGEQQMGNPQMFPMGQPNMTHQGAL
ncbi:hypothetical protein DL767_007062 [Monosporascus sp. MG133]|nr:hypothetical protein DL767_007062 [Monosporascus sp. MG133]